MATPDTASIQAIIDNDPEIQAALQRLRSVPFATPNQQGRGVTTRTGIAQRELIPLLQARGIQMPHDWGISLSDDGFGQLKEKSFLNRNIDWIAPAVVGAAGVVGGAGALGAFGGGGGAGAGAGASAGAAGTGAELGLTGALGTMPAATTTTVAPLAGAGGSMAGTGSILGKLASNPDTYTTALSLLGRLGEGQAGERGDENAYGADMNRALASLFASEQGASTHATDAEERGKLDRAELGLKAPDVRTRQSILGSLLQEMQPFSVGNTGRIKVPTISGGLTPAALNPAARETGSILQKQAIDALLSGSDIPEATDFQAARLPKPDLNQYEGPGTGESILSGLGTAGNTLQGILASLKKKSTTPSNTFTQSPGLGYEGG